MENYSGEPCWNKELMEELYVHQGLSAAEIVRELDEKRPTVDRWLKNHGLVEKDDSELSECPDCGEMFVSVSKHRILNYDCGDSQPDIRATKTDLTCEHCGDKFGRTHPADSQNYFCSTECYHAYLDQNSADSADYNYTQQLWRERAEKVRKRDGYECQHCGLSQDEHKSKYGGALHVHHITPLRKFDDVEQAHKPSNLVTLCAKHHTMWEGVGLRPMMDR